METWPAGGVPAEGEIVEIPAGETVVLDTTTSSLGGLIIRGKLAFLDHSAPELVAEWILVTGEGACLQVGTEEQPFEGAATITMTGTDEERDVMGMGMGNKFIVAADGGSLEFHGGSRSKVGWTQLAETALPGDSEVQLLTSVNWSTGDEIVVAPSNWLADETEKRTVVSVSGATVELDEPLAFKHVSHTSTYEGKFLDQRAEVGLLTRNIVVRGAVDSLESNYGGHLMVMANGSARIEGVEFFRMGQMAHRARYPIHWHLLDRVTGIDQSGDGQYANHNSIHESFNRAIVVHGTGGVHVEGNVSYDVSNHAFVPSEDGDETGNRFVGNIGFLQKSPAKEDFSFPKEVSTGTASTQGEGRSSVFWFRNPANLMEGNRAAGGIDANGFFFDLRHLDREMLDFIDATNDGVMPFRGNLAHSFVWRAKMFGASNGYPEVTKGHGFLANQTGVTLKVFEDFTAYKCLSGVWIDGRQGIIRDTIVADSGSGLVLHRSQAEDIVIVGESEIHTPGEKKPVVGRWGPSGGIQIFDEHLKDGTPKLRDITFIDLPDRPAIFHAPRTIGADPTLENLRFINTPTRLVLKDNQENIRYWIYTEQAYLDIDGSTVGSGEESYIFRRFSGLMLPGMRFGEQSFSASLPKTKVIKVWLSDIDGVDYFVRSDGQVNSFSRGTYQDSYFSGRPDLKNFAYLNAGHRYSIHWDEGEPVPNELELRFEGAPGAFAEISFTYPTPIEATLGGALIEEFPSVDALRASATSGMVYDGGESHLYLRLVGTGGQEELLLAGDDPMGMASVEPPITGREARLIEGLEPGLAYRYFTGADGLDFQGLAGLESSQGQGTVAGLDTSPRTQESDYAFVFEGLVKIDEPGRYLFSVSGEGDVDLHIADVFVAGTRGGRVYLGHRQMRNGDYALEAGYHPIRVTYRQGLRKHEVGIFMNGPGDEGFELLESADFFRGEEGALIEDPGERCDYAEWVSGFDWDSPEYSAEDRDPDADGITNFLEYALGGDPLQPGSSVLPTLEWGASGTPEFLVLSAAPNPKANVDWIVEISTDLTSWSDAGIVVPQRSGGGVQSPFQIELPVVDASGDLGRFYRLRAVSTGPE